MLSKLQKRETVLPKICETVVHVIVYPSHLGYVQCRELFINAIIFNEYSFVWFRIYFNALDNSYIYGLRLFFLFCQNSVLHMQAMFRHRTQHP